MSKNVVTLKSARSLKVIESGTIRYTVYDFLLVSYSNFVPKTHRFWDTDFKNAVTLKTGLGSVKVIGHVTVRWTHTHKPTDRTDYNTLRRSFASAQCRPIERPTSRSERLLIAFTPVLTIEYVKQLSNCQYGIKEWNFKNKLNHITNMKHALIIDRHLLESRNSLGLQCLVNTHCIKFFSCVHSICMGMGNGILRSGGNKNDIFHACRKKTSQSHLLR